MRKGALLLAIVFAATSPSLALAKKAKRAPAKPTVATYETLNANGIRLVRDGITGPLTWLAPKK